MVFGALVGALSRLAPTISKAIPQITSGLGSLTQSFAPQTPSIQQAEQQARANVASQPGLSKGQLTGLLAGAGALIGGGVAYTQRERISRVARRFRSRRRRGRRSF